MLSKHASAKVLLKPASPGTGVIAGGGVRAVLEAAGVKDVLTKSLGAKSKMNATFATFAALLQLKDMEEEAKARGKTVKRFSRSSEAWSTKWRNQLKKITVKCVKSAIGYSISQKRTLNGAGPEEIGPSA